MKSTLNFHWKDWCWSSNTLATWGKEQTHWKIPWCWERWKAWGEKDNRGWDGWTASPTQRTSVWAHSRRWWRTGKPGVLQSMGSQTFGHDWVTEEQHKSSKKQFKWKQHVKFGYNVMRIQNCDKHLEFTSHFSIKEPSHTSSPTYLYLIRKPRYSLLWAKRKFRPSMPWPMWNSPALSPFTTIKVKPVSLCSLKPFLNLLESLLCSPQKNSCEWWIFSCSLGVCVISLDIQTKFWLKNPSCLCWVMTAIGLKIRILKCSPLPPGVFSLFFGFQTGSAVCWWTCTVSDCPLASLCFDLASLCCILVSAEALTNINQFSQLS